MVKGLHNAFYFAGTRKHGNGMIADWPLVLGILVHVRTIEPKSHTTKVWGCPAGKTWVPWGCGCHKRSWSGWISSDTIEKNQKKHGAFKTGKIICRNSWESAGRCPPGNQTGVDSRSAGEVPRPFLAFIKQGPSIACSFGTTVGVSFPYRSPRPNSSVQNTGYVTDTLIQIELQIAKFNPIQLQWRWVYQVSWLNSAYPATVFVYLAVFLILLPTTNWLNMHKFFNRTGLLRNMSMHTEWYHCAYEWWRTEQSNFCTKMTFWIHNVFGGDAGCRTCSSIVQIFFCKQLWPFLVVTSLFGWAFSEFPLLLRCEEKWTFQTAVNCWGRLWAAAGTCGICGRPQGNRSLVWILAYFDGGGCEDSVACGVVCRKKLNRADQRTQFHE